MKKVDNQSLLKHLEKVNEKASHWPQWQQQLLNMRVSNTQKTKPHSKTVQS